MASQIKCNDTTEGNILSISGKAKKERKFKLTDLNRLTFQLEEQGQACDVETATPEQFNAFAAEMADVEDVDVNVWPLEVRRDLVNDLWEYCLTEGYEFPLAESNETSSIPQLPSGLPSEPATCLADVLQGKGYIGEIVQAFKIAMNSPSIPDESNENGEQ